MTNNNDRRVHGVTIDNTQRTDDNLDDRVAKFATQIKGKYFYRIPLRYICNIGKINFPTKIDMKIRFTLETDTKKLFESKKSLATTTGSGNSSRTTIGTPGLSDAEIILLKAPYIQYEQLTQATNFRQYLVTILFSSNVLRMGIQKNPYQKTYQLQTDIQDFTVDFQGANRQFDWIEISLVYDKSDKHLTLHDGYNVECAAKMTKSLEFANISEYAKIRYFK